MNLQIFINDQLVDLSDDSPMALTFQINNLAEVKNQQGNTSNQFKLPLTQRNRIILGFPDAIPFTGESPYRQYPAKVVQDGLEIIPYGVAELNGVEDDTASITILSGNVDFFDAISGKIYEMGDHKTAYGKTRPFFPYDHVWNVNNVATSQKKTDGWIWPIVDYGNIVYNPNNHCEVNVRYLRPGFFIKTAVDLMLASNGYTGTGSLLKDPIYPKLIAQFSNGSFEHGTDHQNQVDEDGISVALSPDFSRSHPTVHDPDGMVDWAVTNADPSGHFKSRFVYDARKEISVTATVNIPRFFLRGHVTDEESWVFIQIVLSDLNAATVEPLVSQRFDFSNGYVEEHKHDSGSDKISDTEIRDTVISVDVDMPENSQLAVRYVFEGRPDSSFTMFAGATWTVTSRLKDVRYGQKIQCERIFPDINQKDLLKDVLQRFGVICQTDNNLRQVNFASFRDIVGNIPIAKNWTSKCLDQGRSISFKLGGYAQVNNMKYKTDDAVMPTGFADAVITVDDRTLPASADLFESQFAPTLNSPYIGGTIAQIKMTDPADAEHEFNIKVSPRILVDQKLYLMGHKNATVRFTDGDSSKDITVNDVISVPYFYKPDGEHNLCFNDKPGIGVNKPSVKKLYYPELEKVLKHTKKVVRYFLISPRDILELDLLIPIYLEQDGAYYYINKIDAWQKGKPTKVELVKLG